MLLVTLSSVRTLAISDKKNEHAEIFTNKYCQGQKVIISYKEYCEPADTGTDTGTPTLIPMLIRNSSLYEAIWNK